MKVGGELNPVFVWTNTYDEVLSSRKTRRREAYRNLHSRMGVYREQKKPNMLALTTAD